MKTLINKIVFFSLLLPQFCLADGYLWYRYSFNQEKLNYVFGGDYVNTEQRKKLEEEFTKAIDGNYEHDYEIHQAKLNLNYMLENGWINRNDISKNTEQWEFVHTIISENLVPALESSDQFTEGTDRYSIEEANHFYHGDGKNILEYFLYGREIGETNAYTHCPLIPRQVKYSGDCSPSYFILNNSEVNQLHKILTIVLNNEEFNKKYKDKKYSVLWDLENLYLDLSIAKEKSHGMFFVGFN
jgi:hypothetical protein